MGNPSADEGNFGFGFNDIDFSDRVLRLEITPLAVGEESECGSDGVKVKTLHISSILLAAKSPFFCKLFKNGTKESDVTLKINASEEAALMDLLKFMYGNPLSATSASDLVDVLMAADKFEVASCTKHCIELLQKLPLSTDSAIFFLELPSNVSGSEVVQPLIKTAKMYLASQYKDFTKSREEAAMGLPLVALEVVLGSDGLKVDSEDDVFDFVMKWARAHYPKLEERREIITKRLMCFICFPNMKSSKLKQLEDCPDFGFPRRLYKYRPIRVEQIQHRWPRCEVYWDITKQDCADLLSSSGRIYTEAFCLGGRDLCLFVHQRKQQNSAHPHFGVFLEMKGSEPCMIELEFAVKKKPSKEFKIHPTSTRSRFTSTSNAWGQYLCEWPCFMSDESVYFIDGIFHIRAQITISN